MKAQIKWVEKRTFLGVSGSGFTLPFGTASGKDGLKGSLGVEHDISHTIDRLEPTGISGLTTVNLDESFNETRPVVSIGLEYNITPNQRLASTLQYQELPYQSKSESNVYLYYTIGF